MKLNEAITILKQHNEWRRGSYEVPMTDTVELGKAIDLIVVFTERVTGEPSDDMWQEGENTITLDAEYQECFHCSEIFQAMINQARKEVEDAGQ